MKLKGNDIENKKKFHRHSSTENQIENEIENKIEMNGKLN